MSEQETHTTEIYHFNIVVNENGAILPEYNDPVLKDIMVFDPDAPAQLRPRLVTANQKIGALEASYLNASNHLGSLRDRAYQQKNQLEEFIKDNFDDLGKHLAEDLASIFDLEMKKTVEFKATIEVKGEIEVDFWTDSEDYFDNVDLTVDFGWGSEGSIARTDVTEIEEI
jgi:hypothetical protein